MTVEIDLGAETRHAVRARIISLISGMDLRSLGLVLDRAETLGGIYAEWRFRWLSASWGFVRLEEMVLEAGICGSCFLPPGACECMRPSRVSQGQALLRLRARWEMSAPTVPEVRWYLSYELRVPIEHVTFERPAAKRFVAKIRGPLDPYRRVDLERLERALASIVEPGSRVTLEEVSEGESDG